jgi:hypothetical protein
LDASRHVFRKDHRSISATVNLQGYTFHTLQPFYLLCLMYFTICFISTRFRIASLLILPLNVPPNADLRNFIRNNLAFWSSTLSSHVSPPHVTVS